jgi:hypothetical protein
MLQESNQMIRVMTMCFPSLLSRPILILDLEPVCSRARLMRRMSTRSSTLVFPSWCISSRSTRCRRLTAASTAHGHGRKVLPASLMSRCLCATHSGTLTESRRGKPVMCDSEYRRMKCRSLTSSELTRCISRRRTIIVPDVMVQEPLQIMQRSRMLFRVTRRLRTHRRTGSRSVGRRFVTAVLAIEQRSFTGRRTGLCSRGWCCRGNLQTGGKMMSCHCRSGLLDTQSRVRSREIGPLRCR